MGVALKKTKNKKNPLDLWVNSVSGGIFTVALSEEEYWDEFEVIVAVVVGEVKKNSALDMLTLKSI